MSAPLRRRGLTTRGRCLLAGGIAAVVCAVILDERDLLRVGLLAVAVPLIAWAFTTTRKTVLGAEHQVMPLQLRPGTTGSVSLTVTNNGRSRTRAVEITEPATPDLTNGLHCLLPSLKGGRSAVATYRLTAVRRGRFQLGPPRAQMADPFGTWEDNRTLPAVTEVLVVPTVVDLHGMPASAGSRSAASGRTSVGTVGGEPDVGVRPYQRGDDIRTVHWRASARHDDLMVRLLEPVSHGGAAVVLDHRSASHHGTGADASIETAVTLAASISLHLLDADHHLRLLTHRGTEIAAGHDIADAVLAGLAMVEADPDPVLALEAVTEPGLLIAVFGALDVESAHRAVAGRRRGANAIAIVLDTRSWGSHVNCTEAVGILGAGGWRVVTVSRGEDLAMAWRQVCTLGGGTGGQRWVS